MNWFCKIAFLLAMICAFVGCEDPLTSHPDEGGIILSIDWSRVKPDVQPSCQVRVIYPSGEIQEFTDIGGGTNDIIVKPGEADMFVFSKSDNVAVAGSKAVIGSQGTNITANAGLFCSYYEKIDTKKDTEINKTAVMNRQTGDLKLSFALTPAGIADKITSASFSLSGVCNEVDLADGSLTGAYGISSSMAVGQYYAVTDLSVLGFNRDTGQNLKVDITLDNQQTVSASADITSLLSDFNVSKNTSGSLNAVLNISNGSATLSNWERNVPSHYLSVAPVEVSMPGDISNQELTIITDQPSLTYSISQTGDWLSAKQFDKTLTLTATANTEKTTREATVTVSVTGVSQSVKVIQESYFVDAYYDKEVVRLQKASVGKGVNIVLMGDGYTMKDMNKSNGKYILDMRKAVEAFFAVYPYTNYRDYFNVWMVAAVSEEEGMSIESPAKKVNNKFGTIWVGGNETGISCNDETVVEYVGAIEELLDIDLENITVILPINTDKYAGTCYMDDKYVITHEYAQGFSIGMCPVNYVYEKLINHEVGGHGFPKLIDEYRYYHNETIPDNIAGFIRIFKPWGWWENVDFYPDIMQTTWKGFANNPKYSMVGTFEGAYRYGKGIWRPEENSCMNDNVPYYNAPSRWAIVRRIMYLAGFDYSFEQFLKDDVVPAYPTSTRSSSVDKPFVPLAPPVLKAIKDTRKRK